MVIAADMPNLPGEILRKIALEHLDDMEDVDSSWRSETRDVDIYKTFRQKNNTQLQTFRQKNNTQLPWLMLADPPTLTSHRRVYSLCKGMYRKIHLPPQPQSDHCRYLSSKGWIISVTKKRGLITFFDPFSGTIITPPSVPLDLFDLDDGYDWDWNGTDYIQRFTKFVFSTRCMTDDDFEVALIFDHKKKIAFWRPAQSHWIQPPHNCPIEDVCFFNERGLWFAVDIYSHIIAFDSQKKQPRIVANLKSLGLEPDGVDLRYNIAVLGTALLVIQRKLQFAGEEDDDHDALCYSEWFKLFQVNVDDFDHVKVTQVEGIGHRALFLGFNSTFFVDTKPEVEASSGRGCRPNCIYVTDDNQEIYGASDHGGGFDMGIYSLEQNKVVAPIYQGPSRFSHQTPPLWIELPHY